MASKKPTQSKTLWFNLATVVATAVVTAIAQQDEALKALLSPQAYLVATSLIATANAVLRFNTRLPLAFTSSGKK